MVNTLFNRILIPVDFSSCSHAAFHMGLQLAKTYNAQIFLLHVIDTKALEALNTMGLAAPSEEKHQKKRLRHHARLLARELLKTPETKGVKITRFLSEGKPFAEITRTARTEKVDLVVMGSYGGHTGDVTRIFFGSTAEQVVRTVNCPVLCVPFPYQRTTMNAKSTRKNKS